MARRLESDTRVLVFIDGQNAYNECRRLYDHGRLHPLLIADRVREGRTLVGVRYYSGVHDPTVDPRARAKSDHRHNLMRRVGVSVIERKLRYRWEWGFDPKEVPNRPERHTGSSRTVTVRPYQRAREKGIDLALGLDVVDLAHRKLMDVAVIVSSDNDLCEVSRSTHDVTGKDDRVSVEAAVFSERRSAILLDHYDYTHQLRRADFEEARDNFDYAQPVPADMQDMFAAVCQSLRANFN